MHDPACICYEVCELIIVSTTAGISSVVGLCLLSLLFHFRQHYYFALMVRDTYNWKYFDLIFSPFVCHAFKISHCLGQVIKHSRNRWGRQISAVKGRMRSCCCLQCYRARTTCEACKKPFQIVLALFENKLQTTSVMQTVGRQVPSEELLTLVSSKCSSSGLWSQHLGARVYPGIFRASYAKDLFCNRCFRKQNFTQDPVRAFHSG